LPEAGGLGVATRPLGRPDRREDRGHPAPAATPALSRPRRPWGENVRSANVFSQRRVLVGRRDGGVGRRAGAIRARNPARGWPESAQERRRDGADAGASALERLEQPGGVLAPQVADGGRAHDLGVRVEADEQVLEAAVAADRDVELDPAVPEVGCFTQPVRRGQAVERAGTDPHPHRPGVGVEVEPDGDLVGLGRVELDVTEPPLVVLTRGAWLDGELWRKGVISVEDWAEIRRLHRADGVSIKQIARYSRCLGVSCLDRDVEGSGEGVSEDLVGEDEFMLTRR